MSKMEPPPDYHTSYSHHLPPGGHHPAPPGGYHPPPPGGYHPHPSGGHHPGYAQSSNNQNQGINNTFAPVMNQPQTQGTNVMVNMGCTEEWTKRDWSTQLYGCCEDCTGCMCALFVPTCLAMTISHRMNEVFCLPLVVPQWMLALRVKMRASNKIKGSIIMDCMVTSCCPLCALCQLKRELDNLDRAKLNRGL